jgi:hypothetical protein
MSYRLRARLSKEGLEVPARQQLQNNESKIKATVATI